MNGFLYRSTAYHVKMSFLSRSYKTPHESPQYKELQIFFILNLSYKEINLRSLFNSSIILIHALLSKILLDYCFDDTLYTDLTPQK